MTVFVEEPAENIVRHLQPEPSSLPEEARELLDQAREKAEQVAAEILNTKAKAHEVAADIEKSKEILERAATSPNQPDS